MYKVLIVDDSKTAQLALKSFLKKTIGEGNFEATVAGSADEALEIIKNGFNPSFMLIDVIMEGMDGINLSKNLLEENLVQKIIIISSQEFDLEDLQKKNPIIKAVVKKPLTKEKIEQALQLAKIKF